MPRKFILIIIFFCSSLVLSSCGQSTPEPTIRLGINPWPGYEFIYLADQKGFFKEAGLDIEIVELSSLADVVRLYNQNRIDAMASTIVEVVDVAINKLENIDIVMVADFSKGGDVIIANRPVSSVEELTNKNVGAEIGLLGSYILAQALEKNSLKYSDVNVVNVEQLNANESLISGEIDAIVTYPPFSTEILKNENVSQIFTSAEIPEAIIDTVSIRHGLLNDPLTWQKSFIQVWQKALDYAESHPEEAHKIMAEREGITAREFSDALSGLVVLQEKEQKRILSSDKLKKNITTACKTITMVNQSDYDCAEIHSLITPIH